MKIVFSVLISSIWLIPSVITIVFAHKGTYSDIARIAAYLSANFGRRQPVYLIKEEDDESQSGGYIYCNYYFATLNDEDRIENYFCVLSIQTTAKRKNGFLFKMKEKRIKDLFRLLPSNFQRYGKGSFHKLDCFKELADENGRKLSLNDLHSGWFFLLFFFVCSVVCFISSIKEL